MKRERGNVILTALFIAVFLFFLSIALIWTNRQDIALSLAMEHKMKAEVAARSGAMRVYTSLRKFDQPPASMDGTLDSGASWKAQLIELPPEGDRGTVVLLQCRGNSGPLSTYFTMHLLKTELGQDLGAGQGRMLGFIKGSSGDASEDGADTPEVAADPPAGSSGLSGKAQVLYGDFQLESLDLGFDGTVSGVAAYQGPLFAIAPLATPNSPWNVKAFLPVFSPIGGVPMAYGPLLLLLPPPQTEYGLSVMRYESEQFQWEPIPFPEAEREDRDPPPRGLLELEAPAADGWTTIAAKVVGDTGQVTRWRDTRPATSHENEALNLSFAEPFEIDPNDTIEWSSAPTTPSKRGYVLRSGAIAAHRQRVYSHAWEYLYQHFSGPFVPAPVPPIRGNTVTRWPCIRSYNLDDKKWSTAWSPLQDSGDVQSELVPDPAVLLVDSNGKCYSRSLGEPSRLLELEPGGGVTAGDTLPPPGTLFLYQDQPHTVSADPQQPGLINLKSGQLLNFDSLPARIPEISGPLITRVDEERLDDGLSDLEVSSLGEDLNDQPVPRTVRCEYNLRYSIDPGAKVATDGSDLYVELKIMVEKKEPTYDFFGTFELPTGERQVLARYDGDRWHILPHGLLAALTNDLAFPGGDMFCAHYAGLPPARSRYSVISIDTDPLEFHL
jgi:hypothetical protein